MAVVTQGQKVSLRLASLSYPSKKAASAYATDCYNELTTPNQKPKNQTQVKNLVNPTALGWPVGAVQVL